MDEYNKNSDQGKQSLPPNSPNTLNKDTWQPEQPVPSNSFESSDPADSPDKNSSINTNDSSNPQQFYQYPNNGMQGFQQTYQTPQPNSLRNEPNGLAIASLILGIISVVFLFCYGIIGSICGIIAIILAFVSRTKDGPYANKFCAMAITGLITGIISCVVGLIVFIVTIVAISKLSNDLNSNWYFIHLPSILSYISGLLI